MERQRAWLAFFLAEALNLVADDGAMSQAVVGTQQEEQSQLSFGKLFRQTDRSECSRYDWQTLIHLSKGELSYFLVWLSH